jgi:hypothetical protein
MKIARNLIAGAISGLGVVILLQQYAVAYPTGIITILGVLIGIAVQFGIAQLAAGGLAFAGTRTVDEPVPEPAAEWPTTEWNPTHRAPASGLDAWAVPDGTLPPAARLDPGLDVRVDETSGEWARITCENGWSAWVDQRSLEAHQ